MKKYKLKYSENKITILNWSRVIKIKHKENELVIIKLYWWLKNK